MGAKGVGSVYVLAKPTMIPVKDFTSIKDYLAYANIRLNSPMDDFLIYHYGQLNPDARLAIKAYRHHFYEITLDVNLGCGFGVDNFTFKNQAGAVVVIGPKRLQSVDEPAETPSSKEGFTLFFHPNLLTQHLNARLLQNDFPFFGSTHSPLLKLSEKALRELIPLFSLIRYEYYEYGNNARETLKNLVGAILHKAKQTGVPVEQASGREATLVKRFEALVGEHFLQLTTVKEYAHRLHVSDKYLSQSVKQVTGRNALEMLHSRRIHYAKALLLHTPLSPTEVSYALNFANPNYFFTYFKKFTGQTPLAYKLENLEYSPPF
jgi:AraC-like DNA-binding protein